MAADGNPTSGASDASPSLTLQVYVGVDAFGCPLKEVLVVHLHSLPGIEVVDLGTNKYYNIANLVGCHVSSSFSMVTPTDTWGLLACDTSVGVSTFTNKQPCVYAFMCTTTADAVNTHLINSCIKIIDA